LQKGKQNSYFKQDEDYYTCVSYLLIKLDPLVKISVLGMDHSHLIILKNILVAASFGRLSEI